MKAIKYIILGCLVTLSISVVAQKHEVSFWGAGGMSTLKYSPEEGSHKNGFGGQIGVGYAYSFAEQFALSTGAELSFMNAKTSIENLYTSSMTEDLDRNKLEFRSTVDGYEDKQNITFVNIPIMLQFQASQGNSFYGAIGGKIGLPMTKKSKISVNSYKNSGYFLKENKEYTDVESMGFGTYGSRKNEQNLELKVAFMLSAEAGMKWILTDDLNLYTGAYVDYGLNNISKESVNKALVAYNAEVPINFVTNSVLGSNYKTGEGDNRIVKKISPLSIGLKVKLAFTL